MKRTLLGSLVALFICACGGGGGGDAGNTLPGNAGVIGSSSSASSSVSSGAAPSSSSSSSSSISSTSNSSASSQASSSAAASSSSSSLALSEQLMSIPAQIAGKTYRLEAKLYTPQDGKDRHPLLIMTHGRNGPAPAIDTNQVNGYTNFNRALARSGYAVLFVVRRGYGNSDGPDSEYLATPEASGLAGAQDLKASVEYMRTQAYVDPAKVVIAGHSQGGWMALASSALDIPGVLGAVNFSGATNFSDAASCTGGINSSCVEGAMKRAAGVFGASNKRPVLWLYAANDNHSVATVTDWFNTFKTAGGQGSTFFTAAYYPANGGNGHGVNSVPSYYLSELLAFLGGIGFK